MNEMSELVEKDNPSEEIYQQQKSTHNYYLINEDFIKNSISKFKYYINCFLCLLIFSGLGLFFIYAFIYIITSKNPTLQAKPDFFLGLQINDNFLGKTQNQANNIFNQLMQKQLDLVIYNGSQFKAISELNSLYNLPLVVKFDLFKSNDERNSKLAEFKHTHAVVKQTEQFNNDEETIVYLEDKQFLCPRSLDVRNVLLEEIEEIFKYPEIKGVEFNLDLFENNKEIDFCYCEVCSKLFKNKTDVEIKNYENPIFNFQWQKFKIEGLKLFIEALKNRFNNQEEKKFYLSINKGQQLLYYVEVNEEFEVKTLIQELHLNDKQTMLQEYSNVNTYLQLLPRDQLIFANRYEIKGIQYIDQQNYALLIPYIQNKDISGIVLDLDTFFTENLNDDKYLTFLEKVEELIQQMRK